MSEALRNSSVPEPPGALPEEVDWLLLDAEWIVTCDAAMTCIPSGAVAIDGDTLVGIGPSDQIRAQFRGRREMRLKDHLILPGLINTHTHAAMTCFRGLGDDLPLHRWLYEVIFPAEAAHVNPDLVYWGTLLACVEMLQSGTTTFCDGYFYEEEAARASSDAGIRAVLGQGILDFPSPDQTDPSRARERAEAFLNHFPTDGNRIRPALFCHAPYTCGPETLRWVKDLCRKHGLLFQIHLSETVSEVEELTRIHGERPVKYLDRLGILDDRTLCAHGVWLEPEEIDLLALRGTGVSHNVESNMKLASGVAPVPRLLAAGVPVGLGTDGCAGNNNLDLFSEMDKVAKVHKVFGGNPTLCPASQVLGMATRQGARLLGRQDDIGSLEVGKKADIVAIDLNQPHLTPLYDPVSHLVYAVKGSDVRHVWVQGQWVVNAGEVRSTDVQRVMREVERICRGIRG